MKNNIVKILSIFMLTLFVNILSSCDDNNEPDTKQKIEVVNALTQDMAKGSITQEEFEQKVVGKVWYRWKDHVKEMNSVHIDSDGKEYPYKEFLWSGDHTERAFYFDSEKYVRFFEADWSDDGYKLHKQNWKYSFDSETGLLYAENGQIELPDLRRAIFYIESVTDTEMVVHDAYARVRIGKDENGRPLHDPYSYRRTVLKLANPEDTQKDWWDKYVEDDNVPEEYRP